MKFVRFFRIALRLYLFQLICSLPHLPPYPGLTSRGLELGLRVGPAHQHRFRERVLNLELLRIALRERWHERVQPRGVAPLQLRTPSASVSFFDLLRQLGLARRRTTASAPRRGSAAHHLDHGHTTKCGDRVGFEPPRDADRLQDRRCRDRPRDCSVFAMWAVAWRGSRAPSPSPSRSGAPRVSASFSAGVSA